MGTCGRWLSGLSTRGLCIGRWPSELELSCLLHIDQSSGEGASMAPVSDGLGKGLLAAQCFL